jgi:hypothetical protein
MQVSNIIHKMHKKYHIPSRIFTAILAQESRYSLKAKGCHKGLLPSYNVRIVDNRKILEMAKTKLTEMYGGKHALNE